MIFRESTGFSRVECQVQQTCAEHLTDETLTPENRDKRIGRSLYRIVKDYDNPPYRWGIFENYNRWETACYRMSARSPCLKAWGYKPTLVKKLKNSQNSIDKSE